MVPDPPGTELPDITCYRPSWQSRAACRGMGTEAFIARRGDNGRATAAARGVCDSCVVVGECLAYALADPDLVGIWGGHLGEGAGEDAGRWRRSSRMWCRETRRSRGRRLAGNG
jgi:WhiB family redox-sensing transcriptional regulator